MQWITLYIYTLYFQTELTKHGTPVGTIWAFLLPLSWTVWRSTNRCGVVWCCLQSQMWWSAVCCQDSSACLLPRWRPRSSIVDWKVWEWMCAFKWHQTSSYCAVPWHVSKSVWSASSPHGDFRPKSYCIFGTLLFCSVTSYPVQSLPWHCSCSRLPSLEWHHSSWPLQQQRVADCRPQG